MGASWDPVMVFARGVPDPVDRAAIRNVIVTGEDLTGADLAVKDIPEVIEADYERPRIHAYSKPPIVCETILKRVCRPGDLVIDPFAGSGSSRVACENLKLDLRWSGPDIDPQYAEEN